ncbi:MAG TPA: hypothetical protein EYO30_06315 [Gemmatimonadetes bacterium]|nr:hypothetical protein [Gemmatimonadota bacterium]
MTDGVALGLASARELAEGLVQAGGGQVRCVLLYGSHLHGTKPNRYSAYDFIVLVDDYRAFYSALKNSGHMRGSVRLMSTMAYILPPNVIAYSPVEDRDKVAKCNVVTRTHLDRALGPRPKDHYLLGRLVQRMGFIWFASDEDREWVETVITGAIGRVLTWMAPYLTEPVDADGLGRRILEVCYRGEFRPEATDRHQHTYEAQVDHFLQVLSPVLSDAERHGFMVAEEGRYRLTSPSSAWEALRWRWHFMRSKLRMGIRALKHTVTFEEWLPYIVRKAERHSGKKIKLTWLELRFPLLFLWPRAITFLLSRPKKDVRQ